MEYEWEENDVSGDVPEFGAIFMSNIATKRECFKQKVFALPSSMVNFVKQVKEGMVLFLFEFEKRQLFGVYRATSDGAINIAPHAFNYSGKQFPAQVCFTPIWFCKPLFENEFREAIRENYFSPKKFHFGLSEDQVRRLLQLFSTRKLNDKLHQRHMTRMVTRPGGKDRRWVDRGLPARRERSEMEHLQDEFTPADMNEILEYTPDRAIEADKNMFFIDDRLGNGKKMNTFGHNLLTDQAADFLHKRKRLYDGEVETELYDTRTSLPFYGTDNQEVSLDKERIPAARSRSLTAENTDDDCNIYSSLSPAIATKFARDTFDLARRADYERSMFEGTNRHGINGDRFLINDTIEKNLNLRDSFRPMVSDENEEDLERPGRASGDSRFFMSRSGHKHHINNDIDPVVPSENFDNPLHRVKGSSGNSKLLIGERIGSEHNLDNGLRLDVLSEKLRNPFDSEQRTFDSRRFLHRDKVMKANYGDGVHGSTTSFVPSEYDRSIPRHITGDDGLFDKNRVDKMHGIEMFSRPVSTKYIAFPPPKQNSLDCFSKSSPDTKFSQLEGPQHFKNWNSKFHDSIVTRTVTSASGLPTFHHRHSLPAGVEQGASLALDNSNYGSGGDSLALSKSKSFEKEGFGRFDHAYDFRNENFHPTNHGFSRGHTAQIPQSMELISSAPTDDNGLVFSASMLGSPPLSKSFDFYSRKKSPLASDSHSILPQGMQKHSYWKENDERITGNKVPSSNLDLAGLDIYQHEKHLTYDALECYKSYNTDVANDDSQHYLNPGGGYSEFEKQRRSVFTRLTSTPRVRTWEGKETDADFYLNKSVDEVMDVLNSSQNFRMKKLMKGKPVVREHDTKELPRTEKRVSPEQAQPRFATRKLVEEVSQAVKESFDELPQETRAVEFKRRSELKKDLDETSTTSNALNIQDSSSRDIHDSTSRENAEPDGPVNKPQKRRKLVRPVFNIDVPADGASDNQNLLSQSQSLANKIQ